MTSAVRCSNVCRVRLPLSLRALVGLAVFALPVNAQELRARQLSERRASVAQDSPEWFRLGCELVLAQFDVHVPAALASATALWEAAGRVPLRGAAEAAAALAEFVAWHVDGAPTAAVWRQRFTTLPESSDPVVTCYFHFARARALCAAGEHGAEAEHAMPAQAAAAAAGVPVLRLHAARMTMLAMPSHGAAWFRRKFAELTAAHGSEELQSFAPWIELDTHEELVRERRVPDVTSHLGKAELEATRQGNRRVLAGVALARAHAHIGSREPELALEHILVAERLWEELGDRAQHASALDLRAWVELRRDDLAKAEEVLSLADILIADRGYSDVEQAIRSTKFDLALRRRDGDAAAALRDAIEARQLATTDAERRIGEVMTKLADSERERDSELARLVAEAALATERARQHRSFAAGVVILALAILAVTGWRSRRRLLLANGRLAEQVERVEAAKAAQAKLEERMRQIERTESLGTMAAGVAHDFNNLLTSILGNAELIASRADVEDPAALARQIAIAGQQASRLCRQLQVYSGGAPLQREPIDLRAWVVGMLPVLRAATDGHVELDVAGEEQAVGALVDRAQVEQALLNLVVNARDARARRVSIQVGRVLPSAAQDVVMAYVSVRDDGEGMSQEVAQRVFDPFFTTRFPGRGLGLAVVYGVARRHGGSVDVTSELGRGTTFTLRLPAAEAPATPPPRGEVPVVLPRPALPATVLVVDDDAVLRQMLQRMLTALGHASVGFGDGHALLAAVTEAPADRPLVMFVDLAMPGLEGDEVIRRARELRPDLRASLMSGHAQGLVEQVVEAIKPDHVLAKPFQMASLRSALAVLLATPRTQQAVSP